MTTALTASSLVTGEAVFWSERGWADRFADAEVFEDRAQADAALAQAQDQRRLVVEPYLIEVAQEAGLPVPVSFRERIRALGPTIHPDIGKQAGGGPEVRALQAAHGAARSSGRLGLIQRKA
ncbi:MAG TPA: DUF2849 domain-containing protein [Caulobacteraceae bacterium]|jgi:hypothetical protein|nr:DUF2849 domain-containing protein [Caulobacteraceae bacterium]